MWRGRGTERVSQKFQAPECKALSSTRPGGEWTMEDGKERTGRLNSPSEVSKSFCSSSNKYVCITTVTVSTWILGNGRLCEYVSAKASVCKIAQAGEGDRALSRASGHRRWYCIATENRIICMHSFFRSHQIGLYPSQANRGCDDKHMYTSKLGRTLLVFCHSTRVALKRWRAGWPWRKRKPSGRDCC